MYRLPDSMTAPSNIQKIGDAGDGPVSMNTKSRMAQHAIRISWA